MRADDFLNEADNAEMKKVHMISELDPKFDQKVQPEFDDKKPSAYNMKQSVKSQTINKDRTKHYQSVAAQTQGDQHFGVDRNRYTSKIGGVDQANTIKGTTKQAGNQWSGKINTTDTSQGADGGTLRNTYKFKDKEGYDSAMGIEKDVADLKNMFKDK